MPNETSQQLPIFPDWDNPLNIKIPVFEGPLDLLLHLIRKKQLEIAEVPLAELTSSYLSYLDWMQSINLDVAGEFLEIAATLIWIKSNALLPKPQQDTDPNEENPEEALRRRLLEYQQYKEAAFELSRRDLLGRDVFTHLEEELEVVQPQQEQDPVFEEVSLLDLMDAFRKILERRPKVITQHVVVAENYRIEDRMEEIATRFLEQPNFSLEDFFEANASKTMLVMTFMAILELMKRQMLCVTQETLFGAIQCSRHVDFHQNFATWKDQQQGAISNDDPQ